MKRFLEEGRMEGEKVVSDIRQRGANRGSYTLRNENEEELLREMLIST